MAGTYILPRRYIIDENQLEEISQRCESRRIDELKKNIQCHPYPESGHEYELAEAFDQIKALCSETIDGSGSESDLIQREKHKRNVLIDKMGQLLKAAVWDGVRITRLNLMDLEKEYRQHPHPSVDILNPYQERCQKCVRETKLVEACDPNECYEDERIEENHRAQELARGGPS